MGTFPESIIIEDKAVDVASTSNSLKPVLLFPRVGERGVGCRVWSAMWRVPPYPYLGPPFPSNLGRCVSTLSSYCGQT